MNTKTVCEEAGPNSVGWPSTSKERTRNQPLPLEILIITPPSVIDPGTSRMGDGIRFFPR